MATLNEVIRYSTNRDDWYLTVLIGGILSIFSFLIVPIILVYGYIVRLIGARLSQQPEPPTFGDWGTLLVDGIKVWVIGLIYLLIPLIVAGFTVGGAIMALASGSETLATVGFVGMMGGFFLSFILALVFGYVAVAGIVNFALTGSFGAAFEFATLKPVLLHSNYAMAWLMAIVILIAGGVVAGLLNVIPILGFIIAAFIYFYVQMVAAGLWADGFNESYDSVVVDRQISSEETAV